MWNKARALLEAAGYTCREGDDALLRMCAEYTEAQLLCDCNAGTLPRALDGVGALRTVGAFLSVKQKFLPEDLAGFGAGGAVERLHLGDADVCFSEAARADAARGLSALIAGLLHYGQELVACHRCVRW